MINYYVNALDAVEYRAFECKDNKLTNADALQHLKFLKVNYNKIVDEHVSTSQYLLWIKLMYK